MTPILMLDLGNVVFPLEFDGFDAWLSSRQQNPISDFYEQYHPIYLAYESGQIDTLQFFDDLKQELGVSFDDDEFEKMWVSCWQRDMPGMEDLIIKYNQHFPIHVLSNTNDLHMKNFFKSKGILEHFDRTFLSHELQCAKPNLEIYQKVTKELAVPPESLLFFDDKIENVEGARACGWTSEVFVDAKTTEERWLNHIEETLHA
jgi:HAD superfamily hydrolase (TIGR01509 family)